MTECSRIPVIQSRAVARSFTSPSRTACSRACEYANIPIGRAALLSWSSRSNAVEVSPSLVMVAVCMIVAVARARGRFLLAVGSGLGLERRFQRGQVEAELAHHGVEHVIVLVEQPLGFDLQRDVAIAQVIRRSQEQVGVGSARARQLF